MESHERANLAPRPRVILHEPPNVASRTLSQQLPNGDGRRAVLGNAELAHCRNPNRSCSGKLTGLHVVQVVVGDPRVTFPRQAGISVPAWSVRVPDKESEPPAPDSAIYGSFSLGNRFVSPHCRIKRSNFKLVQALAVYPFPPAQKCVLEGDPK